MPSLTRDEFIDLATRPAGDGVVASSHDHNHDHARTRLIPLAVRVLGDQLTPVLAYRRLVSGDARTAPSFLLESVENGTQLGRYSILGARPAVEVKAFGTRVEVTDLGPVPKDSSREEPDMRSFDADPFDVMRELSARYELAVPEGAAAAKRLPACALGGWFGYAGYDTVRYAEPEKLSAQSAPVDDRGLADLHFGLYGGVVVFDHVDTVVYVVRLAPVEIGIDAERAGVAYDTALSEVRRTASTIQTHSKPLQLGELSVRAPDPAVPASNMTKAAYRAMVEKARGYIEAGDIFQVVVGQRFERHSAADPFDVYRALRAVNPSPYMVYLQAPGCILVASSPEILCRVQRGDDGTGNARSVVTNRPLAGTRKRGRTEAEDLALERELLADEKERAEHVMLVDLGRNDVGRVARPGSVSLDAIMAIERYSHVMHISSTVTGTLRDGVDAWDALRATLPVGTISGAPKIRAMQIIDELEPVRRGPYGGGLGYAGLDGQMDIALALRTIVVPTDRFVPESGRSDRGTWTYHLQAAGGIVYDSDADAEFQETVNKAMAMVRAIDAAERAFGETR